MVVLYSGKPTESDHNTNQRLCRCNVTYAFYTASVILPYVETIHKRVEVRMEEADAESPYKYTDFSQELWELRVPLEDGNPQAGKKDVHAFDSCIPNLTG
jgi:hypothetical protein